jgi:Helicase HerA, central domain
MINEQRAALAALRFDWAPVPDDVWRPSPFHVDGLHPSVTRDVLDGMAAATASDDGSPIGLVLEGQRGSGKTHMLGWVRQQVQAQGGYFFLTSLLDAKGFWDSVLASMLDGLARPVDGGEPQLQVLLRRLSSRVRAPRTARRAVMGEVGLSRPALDAFIDGLAKYDPYVARISQETARALALSASADTAHHDIAENYFTCGDDTEPSERSAWGMRRSPKTSEELVRELSYLLALTGPSVVAVDQIDTLIAQSALITDHTRAGTMGGLVDRQQAVLLERVAGGLMSLRERTRRTLTLVACLPASWVLIRTKATDTVADRFRETAQLKAITDIALARQIVEKRLATQFAKIAFQPPYPSWPVRPEAFRHATGYTPRQLLIAIDDHVRACLRDGEVRELTRLGDPVASATRVSAPALPTDITSDTLAAFDARFEELRKCADVTAALEPDTEDATVPALLAAGLTAWIVERGEQSEMFTHDPLPSANPPLHARLRLTLDERIEDQVHWCFRAISERHHAVASLSRLRKASTAAGLDEEVAKRKLFVLRRDNIWSPGTKTQQALQAFSAAGGQVLTIDDDDLSILSALRDLLDEYPIDIQPWLLVRKPASTVEMLRDALTEVPAWLKSSQLADDRGDGDSADADAFRDVVADVDSAVPDSSDHPHATRAVPTLTVGHDYDRGQPIQLPLESLRKHTTIFAGSGSGKTVLIRRIVEECALAGVSSIILDPNNDLARLGDRWPEPPPQWGDGDATKATDYLEHTDVVIWTPRRESGRPLSFQPLPDFRSMLDDPDEFGEAVDAAVASLIPRAKLESRANKAHLGLAVLRKAVEHYGRSGGSRLQGLIDTLADFPADIVNLDDADKIAAGLAQTLTATMVNDPLFGGTGSPMDPGLLLTPPAGKRARISVISLVGLPSDEARQSFVNQLQMALFAWIKKHPAGDRPLLGLFVMDEAQTLAPSGAMTACTQSTLALASQARKYGLGLVFATQAPKGLHNRIPGNASTQFFGLLNSPIQIEAVREMAKAKGGEGVPDISRLTSGEFYFAGEGAAPVKVRTPMCLSYHPRSPLTTEEVIDRARNGSRDAQSLGDSGQSGSASADANV